MFFSQMIGRLNLYNYDVNWIYIKSWHLTENYIRKNCFINFSYMHTLTSPWPLVFEGVVHLDLNVSTAKLLSSIRLFIWSTYWEWSRGCLQLHRYQFSWRWYQNTEFGFGLRGPEYFLDDQKRSKLRLWTIKPN